MWELSKVREQQAELSVSDWAKIIFQHLKLDRRQSAYDQPQKSETFDNLDYHFFRVESLDCPKIEPHPHTDMKFRESLHLLQRQGLVMIKGQDYVLTGLGYESNFDENGDLLILDDAEKRIQSVRNEVSNLDPIVADYYHESIRAWQEGLLLSACICIGAASEGTIYALAKAVGACDENFNIQKWQRSDMESKISNLVKKVDGLRRQRSLDTLCFKDIKTKLRNLADWFRITRNDAGHPDRDSPFPEREEVELSICQFRRYVISIFQIIHLFNP